MRRQERSLSLAWSLVPVLTLMGLLALAYALFGEEAAGGANQIALLFSALIAVFVGSLHGYDWKEMAEAARDSVMTGIGAVFILLAVGSLIGTWAMSGTLMAMVYWGLKILSPDFFYFTVVLISAALALCIGSSWTVVGTLGIGLMGISQQMGLDPVITAGAIISGAYFGDKSSPLSDATNLATAAAGADLYSHIVETLWTSVPTLLIALLVFWTLGQPGDFDASDITGGIAAHFNVGILPFLPLGLVLVLAVLRYPPFVTIFLGALFGGIIAIIVSPENVVSLAGDPDLPVALAMVKGVWTAMANGYVSASGSEVLDRFLSRGGMSSMLVTIWLILTALAFGGIVEKIGVLDRLLAPVLAAAKTAGRLVSALVVAAISTNALASDQYIAIVLPGRIFQKAFRKLNLAPVVLSRSVGDSATVTSALVPWNSCGAYMAATLGVATVSYAPYAVFNLLNPIVTIAFAFAGFRMIARTDDASDPKG
ncbi:Na+/H+ antiporter NhaC family protein [Labrenzia sp. OB1]|uniref:Na+/H+ antiporter NhaC family protein n=1 Tax=Labrenzia sp. OB1 TaxID=1561204 RepID=UPI0007B2AF6C|nr:Na+/H+ antiporter NhaC family protein [Labrenzia sp. OB1]KZM50377.1 sodium:proton antiporter [Labrenzia sp. OB1]